MLHNAVAGLVECGVGGGRRDVSCRKLVILDGGGILTMPRRFDKV